MTGSEIAYDLELKGKHPVIVEAMNDIITTKAVSLANSSFLRDYFKWKKVPLMLESKVTDIADGYVTVVGKDGAARKVAADSVIYSVGYYSAPLAPASKNVHVIGDAARVSTITNAVYWGYHAALDV